MTPLLLVCIQWFARLGGNIETVRAESEGVAVIAEATKLINAVQLHRGQMNLRLSGNGIGRACAAGYTGVCIEGQHGF